MIDVQEPLRKAYFQALDGRLSYNGVDVPIADEITPVSDSLSLYVIIGSQDGVQENTFDSFGSTERIVLDVVFKGAVRAAKEPLDRVVGQILGILFPTPKTRGMIDQPGIQINSPMLESSRDISLSLNSANSVVRRILTFRQHVLQT